MNTPIIDFVRSYADKSTLRFHMPGHKGKKLIGFEELDITEISGADSLYEADGIIKQSESNASELFGCDTFYSTEGASLCIRAMMYLVRLYAMQKGEAPLVLAARNAHKTFHTAVALLDIETEWIYNGENESYLSCLIEPAMLEKRIPELKQRPVAVYVTSPDYLGNLQDISALSKVCHKYGILLLVDNAHGAYLRFLPSSMHPIDLGADICCDSAHKTLPCITGGAYLHIGKECAHEISDNVRRALATFGSTSPSYLILQSLDAVNKYISEGYADALSDFVDKIAQIKHSLSLSGYVFVGSEPLKLTVLASEYGYDGRELADLLREKNIEPEFADPDLTVMMIAPENGDYGLISLFEALLSIPKRPSLKRKKPLAVTPKRAMPIRDAMLSVSERIKAANGLGRVLAGATLSCPPAVPIVVSGEIIDENAIEAFEYYSIEDIEVVKEV